MEIVAKRPNELRVGSFCSLVGICEFGSSCRVCRHNYLPTSVSANDIKNNGIVYHVVILPFGNA